MNDERRDRRRERLVRVAVAENPFTAEMIRDALAQAGVRALLRNRDAASVALGGIGGAPWSVEVYVLEDDAPLATGMLGGEPARDGLPPPALDGGTQRRRPWWRRLTGRG